jgi:hypothetical protein
MGGWPVLGREVPLVPQRAQLVLGRAASLALRAHRAVPWWAAPLTASSLPREEKTGRFWILGFGFWIVSPIIGNSSGDGVMSFVDGYRVVVDGAPAGPLYE